MNTEALRSLRACIVKWENNVAARSHREVRLGTPHCPLCTLFWPNDCVGCPIANASGQPGCRGTPYHDAIDAYDEWVATGDRTSWDEKAPIELAFLRSLLPA